MPWFSPMYSKNTRVDGKTIIVTGANTGIGLETARDLYRRGARVIMAVRSVARGQNARAEVIREKKGLFGGSVGSIEVMHLDLGSLKSVRSFADRLGDVVERIDVLINNAGVLCGPRRLTEDGFESQFGINHLGHFLLTLLLIPRCGPGSRIVNVSSAAHHGAWINFNDIHSEIYYDPWGVYCMTKLANILFTHALAQRLKRSGITVYSLHPGVVNTEICRSLPWVRYLIVRTMVILFYKNAVQGAQTTLYCSLDPELYGVSGLYYDDCKQVRPSKLAENQEQAEKLWKVSCEMVGVEEDVLKM